MSPTHDSALQFICRKKKLSEQKKNKRDKSVFFNEEAKFYIFALEDLFWSMLDDWYIF